MKPSTLLSTPLLAVVLFCIASCGGQDNKNGTDTTTTADSTSATTATTNPSRSTITTTPQDMMVVRLKVADFNKWKASYDAHDSMRLASGVHSYVIGRGVKDSNTVLVAVKVDDINKAKAFAKNPSLKQAMQKGGVVGAPLINFTTMTYQDTGTISDELRSGTTFTVKDWDRWQRSFDSSEQTRRDNGLMLRAYGHDVDDNHKVTVVVALTDTAKAYAFWKSDQLKKLQAASGVASQPERFIYRVIKRY
ncbi:MAG: hypothetical protein ICV53_04105 [Flavisolibacter sp.]|nr:hypothetical protein [Flavisolibacter sp.]MBD0365270.1 hypothetical protein [Flavisolibacter sp.]